MTAYAIHDIRTGTALTIVRDAANQAQAIRAYSLGQIAARPLSATEVIDLLGAGVPVISGRSEPPALELPGLEEAKAAMDAVNAGVAVKDAS